ncbi:MAG: hypothetical protein A4E52_01216 [Pelotomaculum sp. PtaB.Bin013]|nr:MAG: hypothetical protein A4E52_01216 [Pelotomaculum sp. PtaB.Bin013]
MNWGGNLINSKTIAALILGIIGGGLGLAENIYLIKINTYFWFPLLVYILGTMGALLVLANPGLGGALMIFAAVGGAFSMPSNDFVIAVTLLFVAGIIATREKRVKYKKKSFSKRK